jgi:hypothetical protein
MVTAEGGHSMDAQQPADDRTTERTERGEAAHRRAEEAGERAAELRGQLDAAPSAGRTPGSTADNVIRSRQRADTADANMERAFERGAQAHDRAAGLHERQIDTDPGTAGPDDHAHQARHHRDAAEADRELARKARERRQPPTG